MLLCKNTLEAEGRVVCKGELASEPSSSEPGSQVDEEGFCFFFVCSSIIIRTRSARKRRRSELGGEKKKKKRTGLKPEQLQHESLRFPPSLAGSVHLTHLPVAVWK